MLVKVKQLLDFASNEDKYKREAENCPQISMSIYIYHNVISTQPFLFSTAELDTFEIKINPAEENSEI